jgi:hypothetical protein
MTTPPSQQHQPPGQGQGQAQRGNEDDDGAAGVPVVFVDENPGVVLADASGPSAALSYWRSLLSPAGAGSVLALWRREQPPEPWTDNPALADLIARTFLRHWPVLGPSLHVVPDAKAARFEVDCDGSCRYRLQASTAEGMQTLLADWLQWQPGVRRPDHQHPGVELDGCALTVSSVVAFCDSATVVLDGRPLPGRVDQQSGPTFVALAESWTTRSSSVSSRY